MCSCSQRVIQWSRSLSRRKVYEESEPMASLVLRTKLWNIGQTRKMGGKEEGKKGKIHIK